MNISFKLFLSIGILFVFGCKQNYKLPDSITQSEYDIYSVVIDSLCKTNKDSFLFIRDSTDKNNFAGNYKGFIDGKWIEFDDINALGGDDSIWAKSDYKELASEYKILNKRRYLLDIIKIQTNLKLKQIYSASLRKIFNSSKNGWADFYKLFPKAIGIVELSRVGFNKQENQAVFYISYLKGDLNAVGLYILLYKESSKWQIKKIVQAWVS